MEINLRELLKTETAKAKEEFWGKCTIKKQMETDKNNMEAELNETSSLIEAFKIYKYFIENIYNQFIANQIIKKHPLLLSREKEINLYRIRIITDNSNNQAKQEKDNYSSIEVSDNEIVFKVSDTQITDELKIILGNFLVRNELSFNPRFNPIEFVFTSFDNLIKSYESERYLVLPMMEEYIQELISSYGENNIDNKVKSIIRKKTNKKFDESLWETIYTE